MEILAFHQSLGCTHWRPQGCTKLLPIIKCQTNCGTDLKTPKHHPAKTHMEITAKRTINSIKPLKPLKPLHEVTQIQATKTFGLLMPMSDIAAYGNLAGKILGPYEVVLEDPVLGSSYKRLTLLLPLSGTIKYQLAPASHKCTAAEFAELVLELDSRLLSQKEFEQAAESPIHTFRKLLLSTHSSLNETINIYGLRKGKHPTSGKDDTQLQCMTRVPKSVRHSVLEKSGTFGLLIRDFLEKGKDCVDATVLPRFWLPTVRELHDMSIVTKGVDGYAGVVLTRRGLALRVWTSKIGPARRALLADDPRLTDENINVVPKVVLESSGWPPAIDAANVVASTIQATGCPPVPTKAFRAAGVYGWTLAFEKKPALTKFTVQINSSTHEILLAEPVSIAPKQNRQQPPKSRTKQNQPAASQVQYPPPVSKHPDSDRIDRLEAKIQHLDSRQTNLETQLNSRFDQVGAQLQQILNNTSQPRQREPSGETPPPKFPKQTWLLPAGLWTTSFGCFVFIDFLAFCLQSCILATSEWLCNFVVSLVWPRALFAVPVDFSICSGLCGLLVDFSRLCWTLLVFAMVFVGSSLQTRPFLSQQHVVLLCPVPIRFTKQITNRFRCRSLQKVRLCFFGFLWFGSGLFDSTLGFPGEGPVGSHDGLWSLVSANVGSLNTNVQWKAFEDKVLCLQETRVGRNNLRTATKSVEATGRSFFGGGLLPGFIQKTGGSRIAHGGTAILAPPQLATTFDTAADQTGLYGKLFDSNRVHAVWIQVTKKIRLLVFNVYARTGASSSDSIFDENNELFADIFLIASQFGSIPIIIAGDFQHFPTSYPAISQATHFMRWHDPLMTFDDQGQLERPLTFSRDRTFSGWGDGCSSIDAILLNEVAFNALVHVEVIQTYESQHRPIRAVFKWETITQAGFVLTKPAPLDLSGIEKETCNKDDSTLAQICRDTWANEFEASFEGASTLQEKWDVANSFAIQSLLHSGAKWGHGPRTRATQPTFQKKLFCPGQLPMFGALTRKGAALKKVLNNLLELQCRLERPFGTGPDQMLTSRTSVKTWWKLHALGSPFLWTCACSPLLVDIFMNVRWVHETLTDLEVSHKKLRIASWKFKVQQAALGSKAYIFRHLKNKLLNDPPNLVTDDAGNVLFQPCEAISAINNQWDTVFAANVQHPDPLQVLRFIWPYLPHDSIQDCDLPDVTEHDLMQTIQARDTRAAPGLDGWRTEELQALPAVAFKPFALCFKEMEVSNQPFPSILLSAKQMILNKSGDSSPLAKRLITVLPILLLAYTGARFRQLKPWQALHMPRNLHGAIPGRQMSDIYTKLQLDIDDGQHHSQALVGIKLDKAKCFDRLLPSLVIGLCLAFKLPATLANFIARMYEGLKRYLSYKGWFSKTPTTAANGMAQGCSLSLIAINLYMRVWLCFVERLPQVSAHAFVDDSYIWARLSNICDLQIAMQITDLWDALSGQLTNTAKCTAWGTSSPARKAMKRLFPNMSQKMTFDVLGALVNTTLANRCGHSQEKTEKMILDTRNIAALPLPVSVKTVLLRMKVISQCTFAATMNSMSQNDAARIQNEIAKTLWGRRPKWRSKWLLMGLLHHPHKVEPLLARAYAAIRDFMRLLRTCPEFFTTCVSLMQNCHKTDYMFVLRDHFASFAICLFDDLSISFCGSQRISLQKIDMRELAACLIPLARHACYASACATKRKDIRRNTGVLDPDLSRLFLRHSKLSFPDGPPASAHFEAQLVGCTLTRDRLAAANLSEDDRCRFCNNEQENLPHLVRDCSFWSDQRAKHPAHEFGANFELLGIVEHPPAIAAHRLQVNDPAVLTIQNIISERRSSRWTDGSLFWPHVFWLCAGGFAVIDDDGACIQSGEVHSFLLTSYTTELWAVIVAASSASSWIEIFSDCKTVVEHVQYMIRSGEVIQSWPHQSWWRFLLHLFRTKHPNSAWLRISWIPSHVLEHVPCELITDSMALAHGTTAKHILMNRIVDGFAKSAAISACSAHPKDEQMLYNAVLSRQEWLTYLHYKTGDERNLIPQSNSDRIADGHSPHLFPQWLWDAVQSEFSWTAQLPHDLEPPPSFNKFLDKWPMFRSFISQLQWKVEDSMVSYAELAVLFFCRGFASQCYDPATTTFKLVMTDLRKMFTAFCTLDNAVAFPGHRSNLTKSCGRTFPTGVIQGASVYFTNRELLFLQTLCLEGAGQAYSSWNFFLADFEYWSVRFSSALSIIDRGSRVIAVDASHSRLMHRKGEKPLKPLKPL